MRKFLANKFNLNIVKDKSFPQTIAVTALQHKYASNNPEDAIENCVDFINDHGGFTVVMWQSRVESNNKSSNGMATQGNEGEVDASRMN